MADVDPTPRRRPRVPRNRLPDSPDAVDIAMAESNAAGRPEPVRLLLERQAALSEADLRHRRLQIRAERLAIALKGSIVLVVVAALLGLGAMAGEAWESHDIVIERFQVPASLEAEGITGEVVASMLHDRLTDLQSATSSSGAAEVFETGWRDDYPIAIPQTDIAIGEVRTALHRWLGDDTRIGGEIYRTRRGIAITIRTSRGGNATFEGDVAQLDALASQAAEAAYGDAIPYRYALLLHQSGRTDKAAQVLRELAADDVEREERALALSGLGYIHNSIGRCAEAVPILERATRLDPRLALAADNLGTSYFCLGDGQSAVDLRRQAVAMVRSSALRGDDRRELRKAWRPTEAWLAQAFGDYRELLRLIDQMELDGKEVSARRATALALMRDVRGSMRLLAQVPRERPTNEQRRSYWTTRYHQSVALDDWEAAAIFRDRAQTACRRIGAACSTPARTQGDAFRAAALARAGDVAVAHAITRTMSPDCYNCAWARALVAEAGGAPAQADRWFARAVRLGPRLPLAYIEWAKASLDRGDSAGALSRFTNALRFAPEQPEAHKGRADALARLGRRLEALRSYQAAAERAPRWGGLHLDWGISLWQSGRRGAARERLNAAAGMDLSRRDRARLRRILTIANRRI